MNWTKYNLPAEVDDILSQSPKVNIVNTTQELLASANGGQDNGFFEVTYEVPGKGRYVEAAVARVRNGLSVNYPEPYMRRRDLDCVFVGDDLPTDKERFHCRFNQDFAAVRTESFIWLKTQELAIFGFTAGEPGMGLDVLAIVPANAGFFAWGLAMLQGIIPYEQIPPIL